VDTDQLAASEPFHGAMGLAIVTEEAVAAGVASIPSPYGNSDSDVWMFHQYFANQFTFGDATGFAKTQVQYILDGKAMRKLTTETRLAILVQNASATSGIEFQLDFRILSLLP